MNRLQELKSKIQKASGKKELLESQFQQTVKAIGEAEQKHDAFIKAQIVIQQAALETQGKLKIHIEGIVQKALDAVFPGQYQFIIKTTVKNNKTAVEFFLNQDGFDQDILFANGGGLTNMVSLALRCAVWSISKTRKLLILDEPFHQLSAKFKPYAAELLRELSNQLGLQIIMVTHDQDSILKVADNVISI